jgi:hypothetical protein
VWWGFCYKTVSSFVENITAFILTVIKTGKICKGAFSVLALAKAGPIAILVAGP